MSRQRWIVLLAALLAVALAARLGWWQLDRAAQKTALQQAIEAKGRLAPLAAAELRADESQLHRSVRLRGEWLEERSVFLENRPMAGRVGFYVVTPLRLEGRAEAILVQRGWIPRDMREREQLPALATPAGPVEIEGRLIAAPARAYQIGAAGQGRIRQNLASAAYAQEIAQPLLPLTVLQLPWPGADDGLSRDWPLPDTGLQKHYGYAFQWFALAALILGLYVWFQLLRPRFQSRR
jgi:surfeit locus 1 family protein